MDFAIVADHWDKKNNQSEKRQVLELCQRTEKSMEYKGDGDTNGNWCTWNDPKRRGKELDELETGERIETIQTTALLRSSEILRRVPVTGGDLM